MKAFSLRVRDDRGYVDLVQLHQGKIIDPTGIPLQPGMVVSISGYNAGEPSMNAGAAEQLRPLAFVQPRFRCSATCSNV